MADEPLTIRGISWRQTFAFINLFRAFRVAVHPSKLVLALVALMLLYAGGHLMDLVWSVQYRAVPGEVTLYEAFAAHAQAGQKFIDLRQISRDQVEAAYAQQLLAFNVETDPAAAARAARHGEDLGALKNQITAEKKRAKENADTAHKNNLAIAATPERRDIVDREYRSMVREVFATASTSYQSALQINNIGLFETYFDYESNQLSNMVRAILDWNWLGQEQLTSPMENPLAAVGGSGAILSAGVLQSVVRFFTVAPLWLLTQHPLFFFLFGFMFLVLWSIFGGAICRIAAVHVARDEKLSIRSALMFSGGKFLSFLFAPLIPMMIVVAIGLLVTVGSALANVPYFGPIFVGAVFVLALAAGFVMALVLVGLIGGFNLMYPTVAVEGSDSFDAISRSFSYLYARPWKLGFYTLVSLVYGTVSYLFVRLFIFLMLVLAYKFSSLAVFATAPSTAPLWPSLWPDPATSGRLSYEVDTLSLTFAQEIGARLIWLWVHLVIAILGAFAVCFYFSANTIIYYLMRREVDATDLDDVYLEQVDDEFADPITPDVPPPTGMPSTAAIVEKASALQPEIKPDE